MQPYFETVKSFADVPIHPDGIDTRAFLEASDGLVGMFDLLGTGVFGFVQADIQSNIKDVRAQYESLDPAPMTVERIISLVPDIDPSIGSCAPSLTRLVRGLAFTCLALQNMQENPSRELHVCFKASYDTVLKHHHSFIIRSVVYVALHAVPHRRDFYNRIAQGAPHDKLDEEMRRWLAGLDGIVKRLKEFLKQGGFGTV
ncbi:glycolipid transfer protein [Desarmillaria tabescens]|uniref:Glycolipid transfer protein n=1 Tax=Armillaria tabescens TaxID=1929756 RepID=A0AA39JYX7_ARMTA|nr:glycolipid transfer protein [Desarmillaria tabescens]KAK0450345.1 glycolipid transfer protein [Desarmillaria tabescens]